MQVESQLFSKAPLEARQVSVLDKVTVGGSCERRGFIAIVCAMIFFGRMEGRIDGTRVRMEPFHGEILFSVGVIRSQFRVIEAPFPPPPFSLFH
jgi:hypothetical protein